MTRVHAALAIGALLILIGVLYMTKPTASVEMREYVITETGMPTSLDPLDADSTQNLPVARMLYATPLEISLENELTSSLLEDFKYLPDSKEIRWKLKQGLKYSDGTGITAEDIAFSVSRMAFARPKFPVLENILGLSDWLSSPEPLNSFPAGIKISDNVITIKLAKSLPHPLFRFCLELFSVIPKRCVDAKSNKISCENVPSSGPYVIAGKDNSVVQFQLREDFSNKQFPNKIEFKYIPANEVAKQLSEFSDHTVVATNEALLNAVDFEKIQSNTVTKFLPAARMTVFLLNPKSPEFKDQKCRWAFARDIREEYSAVQNLHAMESSIFTKIVPGYLKNEELLSSSTHKNLDLSLCRSLLKKSDLKWGVVKGEDNEGFLTATRNVLKKYEISASLVEFPNRKDLYKAFESGDIDLTTGGTGFWALDPIGDLKMLFTPNLHKTLAHIAEDTQLQKLIAKANDSHSVPDLIKVNQYLYDQALFNVFSHVRRFYFTNSKKLLNEIPFAITSPAPWQVFSL